MITDFDALIGFLLGRITEQEAEIRIPPEHYAPFEREQEWCPRARTEPLGDLPWGPDAECLCDVATWQPSAEVLAECERKRMIVEPWEVPWSEETYKGDKTTETNWLYGDYAGGYVSILQILASAHVEHPDFREEWRI